MSGEIIITERLIFKELSLHDFNDFYTLENDSEVRKFIPNMNTTTKKECREILKKHIAKYKDGTGIGTWAVVLKENRKFAGITGLRYLDDLGYTEIGIRLLPDYWSKGYATETGKALLKYGFERLNLNEIIAMALPENEKSMNSLFSIGLKFEGYGYFRGSKVAYFKNTKYDYMG